jgi:hypothetical protein
MAGARQMVELVTEVAVMTAGIAAGGSGGGEWELFLESCVGFLTSPGIDSTLRLF